MAWKISGTVLAAQAARVRANGPQRPGTAARPRPAVAAQTTRPLPAFMQGITGNLLRAGAPQAPGGNVKAEMQRFQMPQHLTSQIRAADEDRRYGPVVGSRAQVATVGSFQGLDGFSFGKLTKWVSSAAAAIASKDPAAMLQVASAAVPGGKTPAPAVAAPMQPVAPTQVEQVFQSMKPQNTTQTAMLIGAGLLGVGLVVMMLKRR